MPSTPSHRPARPITSHIAVVSAGQGDTTASAGAKKKPAPMYHDDPARSDANTNLNHRGIAAGCVPAVVDFTTSRILASG